MTLGEHIVPIVILLVELIAAIVMIGLFVSLKRKKKLSRDEVPQAVIPRGVFQNQPIAVLLVRTSDFYPLNISENFEELLGVSADKIMGDVGLLSTVAEPESHVNIYELYKAWDGKEPISCDFHAKNGNWIRFWASRGEQTGEDLFTFYDITDLENGYLALKESLKDAEGKSEYKTNFLSHMSHEIRTPMNGIIGMISLAEKENPEERVMQCLTKADELSRYLLSIMNDILDLSRIEAGKLELEERAFDLAELAHKLDSMFRRQVEEKGVRYDVTMQDFDVTYVVGDELRLSQVLINFLSNAVKFTKEGEITVTFKQMLIENGTIDIMAKVHDTGIGIEPEFLNRIFKPFEQESQGITRKYGGTGLGMAITDNIVRLMGGTIVIDSMPGKGSDFNVFLTLPIADEAQAKSNSEAFVLDAADDYSYDGKKILLAEDNEINAEITVEILQSEGAEVDVAKNGVEAVEMFERSEKNHYDFILMDVQMPEMNGWDAAKKIRTLEREDARSIFIFALSADAFVEDRRHSLEVGMDGHFSKPINFDTMRKEIGQAVRKGRKK